MKYDAVVVGAGHNGLTAATYLAKAGLKILVIERRNVVGGCCVTEELFPRYKFNTGAGAPVWLRTELIEELKLSDYGFRIEEAEPRSNFLFPDGKHLAIWSDYDRTIKEIQRFSDHDARSYPDYQSLFLKFGRLLSNIFEGPPPPIADILSLFHGREKEELLQKIVFGSAKQILDEFFESDHVKAVFGYSSIDGVNVGPSSPGSAWIMALHMPPFASQLPGQISGGMGTITTAISSALVRFGGDVLLESEVARVLVKDRSAQGVELANGHKIEARVVLSNADAKRTFLRLVEPEELDQTFVHAIRNIQTQGIGSTFHCALRELPDYIALREPNVKPHLISICPSLEYVEKAWDDSKYGRCSEQPAIDIRIHSLHDSTISPPGKHSLSMWI